MPASNALQYGRLSFAGLFTLYVGILFIAPSTCFRHHTQNLHRIARNGIIRRDRGDPSLEESLMVGDIVTYELLEPVEGYTEALGVILEGEGEVQPLCRWS